MQDHVSPSPWVCLYVRFNPPIHSGRGPGPYVRASQVVSPHNYLRISAVSYWGLVSKECLTWKHSADSAKLFGTPRRSWCCHPLIGDPSGWGCRGPCFCGLRVEWVWESHQLLGRLWAPSCYRRRQSPLWKRSRPMPQNQPPAALTQVSQNQIHLTFVVAGIL